MLTICGKLGSLKLVSIPHNFLLTLPPLPLLDLICQENQEKLVERAENIILVNARCTFYLINQR